MRVPSGVPASITAPATPPLTRISVPDSAPRARVRKRQVRDRRDGRKRFAPEPERRDRRQVVRRPDLAGRVPLERQSRVLRRHPLAIVLDADEPLAAELGGDGDAPRARVEAVLDQLLDNGGRALDHLSGRDLIRQPRWQLVNACHHSSFVIRHSSFVRSFNQIHPRLLKNHSITRAVAIMPSISCQNIRGSSAPPTPGRCMFMP